MLRYLDELKCFEAMLPSDMQVSQKSPSEAETGMWCEELKNRLISTSKHDLFY